MFVPRNGISTPGSTYSNYVSNFINYRSGKPTIAVTSTTPTVKPEIMSEQSYTSSLESFVKMMDNSALDSVTKFIKNLRQPPTNGLSISTELFSQVKGGEIDKEQLKVGLDALHDIAGLSSEGYDVTFLEKIEPSLEIEDENR
jgi:hypothetical protein